VPLVEYQRVLLGTALLFLGLWDRCDELRASAGVRYLLGRLARWVKFRMSGWNLIGGLRIGFSKTGVLIFIFLTQSLQLLYL
jgi:hypothetical protein